MLALALVLPGVACLGRPAFALQPLEAFVGSARARSFDQRQARASARQRQAIADEARAGLLPVLSARGSFAHNQYEVAVALPFGGEAGPLVIQPKNQVDGFFTLQVPLVDLARLARVKAARAGAAAAAAQAEATALAIEQQVGAAYHRLIGVEALSDAAARAVRVAEANLATVRGRRAEGAASDFDISRAAADLERTRGQAEEVALSVALARRALATLTGLEPEPVARFEAVSLEEEPPLATFTGKLAALPAARAAAESRSAAEAERRATRLSLLPTLSATAEQRFTNAEGFVGHKAYYTVGATLSWSLDAGVSARQRAAEAAASASAIEAERVARAAEDDVFEAWQRVRAAIAKAKSARAGSDAATRAAALVKDRYGLGASTQLEVIEAEREAFAAEASRISADADLAFTRLQLRLVSGQSLLSRTP